MQTPYPPAPAAASVDAEAEPTAEEIAAAFDETEPNALDVPVSIFADAFAASPRETTIAAVLDGVRSGLWREQVEHLRALRADDAEAYDREKRSLPAFCMSGTAKSRTEPMEHSGLLQVDTDKLGGSLDAVRARLKADPHLAFGFVSPSGDGLKCGLRIDGTRHAESFTAAQSYFRTTYGVEIDPKVKDRLRLCFVSYDPGAWTNADAAPLPVPATEETETTAPPPSGATPEILVLPCSSVSISESARAIFERLAPSRTLFSRGGAIVELVEVDGQHSLDVLRPEAFRSRVEKFGNLYAWRSDGDGNPVLKRAKMSLDDARALMATTEARGLPPVAVVVRCPLLIEAADGAAVLGQGYHSDLGGALVTAGETPPQVPLAEAAKSLRWLVEEFDFQSPGDHSRALAALITPALQLGGHVKGNVPIDAAEADRSQSGKGYRHVLVASIYNERAYIVTGKSGGVGSTDESFAAGLVAGRPFVCLDNIRGRMDSQHLEAFLTAPGLFPARVPHRGEILVNPRRFLLQLSSNGFESTADLANRASICRIRKRPGFSYRDTLGELQKRQPFFLGCVFSVVAEWLAAGKPRTNDTRHDFREWCQALDWICQHVLGAAPLMDGHEAAQERTSNPALTWLRAVAIALAGENRLGLPLTASALVEACENCGVPIPGDPDDDAKAARKVGSLMRQLFAAGESRDVDGFRVTRTITDQPRTEGGPLEVKHYTFAKA